MQVLFLLSSSGIFLTFLLNTYFYSWATRVRPQRSKLLYGCLTSQHFNVGSTFWINVEITLIRRWKWNKIRRRIFDVVQRWYNVSARHWNNVTQGWYKVVSTLFERRLDGSENYIGSNRARNDYWFVNRWIVFILLNDKMFLLTIQVLLKHQKSYLCSMN